MFGEALSKSLLELPCCTLTHFALSSGEAGAGFQIWTQEFSLNQQNPGDPCPNLLGCSRHLCQHQQTTPSAGTELRKLHLGAPVFSSCFPPFLESYCELFCRLLLKDSAALTPCYLCESGSWERHQQFQHPKVRVERGRAEGSGSSVGIYLPQISSYFKISRVNSLVLIGDCECLNTRDALFTSRKFWQV